MITEFFKYTDFDSQVLVDFVIQNNYTESN